MKLDLSTLRKGGEPFRKYLLTPARKSGIVVGHMANPIQLIAVSASFAEPLLTIPSDKYSNFLRALDNIRETYQDALREPEAGSGRAREAWFVQSTLPGVMADHNIPGVCKLGDHFDCLEKAGAALGYAPGTITTKLSNQYRKGGSRNVLDIKGVEIRRASSI